MPWPVGSWLGPDSGVAIAWDWKVEEEEPLFKAAAERHMGDRTGGRVCFLSFAISSWESPLEKFCISVTSLTFACAAFTPSINPFLTLYIWSGFCFPDQPPSDPQGQGKKRSILDLIILFGGWGWVIILTPLPPSSSLSWFHPSTWCNSEEQEWCFIAYAPTHPSRPQKDIKVATRLDTRDQIET